MFEAYASEDRKTCNTLVRHRQILRGSAALCALTVALSFAGGAHAQSVWTGGNGNWNETAKWSNGALPSNTVPAGNAATPTVIGSGQAGTVTIDASTGGAAPRNIQVGNGNTLQIIGGGLLATTPSVDANSINTIGFSNAVNAIGFGEGAVVVDGTGSTWNAGTAGVRVGNGAKGTLTVANGGTVDMQNGLLSVGLNAGGNGTLNIKGGKVENDAAMRVGYNGATGTVNITNGGTLTTSMNGATTNNIGDGSSGTAAAGIVNISGAGSNWSIGPNGELTVGHLVGGTGTLNVTDGGKLSFQNTTGVSVGFQGGTGNVLVSGAGASIESAGGFSIANTAGSKGDVKVENGGSINADHSVVVGREAGADAKLTISGGGKVTGGLNVGVAEAGAKGMAIVDGQGSKLETQGQVIVGSDAGSQGTLSVSGGAVVKGARLIVGQAGGVGTLNIGTGARSGAIDANAVWMGGASSTINFNHSDTSYTFGTAINDVAGFAPTTGAVNFVGTGTTTLTKVNDYTAATNVNKGKLVIGEGASIGNSSLTTVNTGGTLSGKGTTGNVLVKDGGAISQAAGDTLHVKDITFAANSNYLVGANATGDVGNIAADKATLQGGTVKVTAGTGNYLPTERYTILTANNGVSGTFNSVVATDLTFLKATLDYSIANQVDLTLARNTTAFATVAATPNQRAVAIATDGLTLASPVYKALVQQNAGGARQAFDALSGEVHASNQSALMSSSLMVSDTINDHVAASFDRAVKPLRYAAWAQGFGAWMDSGSDGNAADLNAITGGIISGVDVAVASNWRVGVAAGYSRTDTSVDARASSVDTDSTYVSAYTGTRLGLFGVQFGGGYSWKEMSSTRNVSFPAYFETVRGSYNADTAQAFGEVNYRYLDGTGITLLPFAGLSYINLQTDAFTETGAAGLSVADSENSTTFSTIGLRGSAFLGKSYGASFTGRGTLAWRHAYGDTDTGIVASLAGSAPFIVGGVPIAEDSVFAEVGLDVNVLDDVSVGISWAGQFGNDVTEDQLKGRMLYRW